MTAAWPYLSIIVPAHRGEQVLRRSLPALVASDLPRAQWELIVVDDASPDETSVVAAEYADVVVRLRGRPRGPAYARNRGVEVSRGEVVVFVDADVCVHDDVLSKFAALCRTQPDVAAAFGSYDANPPARGVISQFRNLLHHHVHQSNAGDAETFWAGCGAVRRAVLLEIGLMDAWHFRRPQIEDIELGRRLRRSGHRILLRPDIQCAHLKRWTLRNMVTTDFKDRGTPWMWMLLAEGPAGTPATLNLKAREKVCTLLVAVVAVLLLAAGWFGSVWLLAGALAAALMIVALNHSFYRRLTRARGITFAAAAVPLHLVFYFTGGLAAVAGVMLHLIARVPKPPRDLQNEQSQGGWPPPIDRPAGSIWTLAAARNRK